MQKHKKDPKGKSNRRLRLQDYEHKRRWREQSKNPNPRQYCPCARKSKLGYKSLVKAARAAKWLTKKYGIDLYPYYCKVCKLWHLTSQPIEQEGKGETNNK
jgi:hypothetical protein